MEQKTAYWNLDELLKRRGLTKTQLSYRAEVSHTQINKMCRGETLRVDLATISRLCTVLDCDISDLFKFQYTVVDSKIKVARKGGI